MQYAWQIVQLLLFVSVEEVPVDSHLQKAEGSNGARSHSRSTSVDLERERDRRLREERRHREDK